MEPALKRWPDDAGVRALTANALFGRGTELLDAGENDERSGVAPAFGRARAE